MAGHPTLRNNSFGPSAVVYQDGGWWLHHTHLPDILALLMPWRAAGLGA